MQIRTLFLVCMSAVAALATCLGAWMQTQMAMEYRLAGGVERAVEIDALLFVVADRIATERQVVAYNLLGDAPIDGQTLAVLKTVRQDSDTRLNELERRIQEVDYPGSARQLAVVENARTGLVSWRTRADVPLNQPKSRREPNFFARSNVDLNAILDAVDIALDIGDVGASLHDGKTAELIVLSRNVWTVRSMIPMRIAPLMQSIDNGALLGHHVLEAQAQYQGVLDTTWRSIATLSRHLYDVPGLATAIATGRVAFESFDGVLKDVIAAGRTSAVYPVSATDLDAISVETAPLLLQIRDQALDTARARAAESRHDALVHVVIAAIVLGLTAAAIVVVLVLLQRRIVAPVLALTEVIGRIAQLDFDVTIPARKRTDEIGRMANALDALRHGAMAGEESKAKIAHLARHDALTGLSNRLALQERLEQTVALAGRGHTSAVLCLDLDRFKAVNDTFGHPTGDLLLQAVSERLLACVRDVDAVHRLGGDEFVVVLLGIDQPDQAAMVAQRIVRTLGDPFDLNGQTVSIGCSVGIAVTPRDATSGVALLKHADTALYRAKAEEKGGWRFFKPEMDAHLLDRMALERDLREAVQNEAFELAYQPQYNLAASRLSGFEALLRWRHPVRGMIGPAQFIPIAEETGLIVPIGIWVLRNACAEAANWPDDIMLAVNLSGVQFKNLKLVQTVRQALIDAGLPPARLELEITETVLLNNSDANLAMLRTLHDMGIRFAMDDFGTGYSSLSTLRSFPFDKIKIDQSFIRDLSDDAGSRAIVRSIVALGNSLGMTTTAEGVETADQLAHLRLEGCDDVQGYYFSKPISADAARALVPHRPGSNTNARTAADITTA